MNCEYGCGQPATFKLKSGKQICSKSWNSCPAKRDKGSVSLKASYDNKTRKPVCYDNFSQSTKNNMAWNRDQQFILNEDLFCENSNHTNDTVKRFGIRQGLLKDECYGCGIAVWRNQPIVLELEHINGNSRDHRISNLQMLCPNCHSQTPTFRGRNIKTTGIKVAEADLVDAIKSSKNIRQALIKVGLSPKGCNYFRVREVMNKHGLSF